MICFLFCARWRQHQQPSFFVGLLRHPVTFPLSMAMNPLVVDFPPGVLH
jgi:hypothetical protein